MEQTSILYAIDEDAGEVAFMVRDGSTLKPEWERVDHRRFAEVAYSYAQFWEAHFFGINFYDVAAQIAASEEVQS